jgi:hypothetical protein
MKKIKLYDFHGQSAVSNFKTLITNDRKYFYWDFKRFKKYQKGDVVFWINRINRVAIYSEVDETEIIPEFSNGKNIISDLGYEVNANAKDEYQFEKFYRFKCIEVIEIPESWSYNKISPFDGQTMAIILYEEKANNVDKKIAKIDDLIRLFEQYPDARNILLKAKEELKKQTSKKKRKNIKLQKSNTVFEMKNYNDILTAIQTKPFILLAGISGTGKSRLVRELAFKTCNNENLREDNNKPGNYELISVKPNWHDSSELIGYISRINGEKYIATPFIKFIAKAWSFPKTPFFLCLDEMNLAPVEQYFAEYLSIIETRTSKNGIVISDAILDMESIGENNFATLLEEIGVKNEGDTENLYSKFMKNGIQIPNNLIVMGTVNMDETTYSFSRKVLDRAMTIEMNNIDLYSGLDIENNELSYPSEYISFDSIIGNKTIGAEVYGEFDKSEDVLIYLKDLNKILDGSPFKIAYRVRDEFLIYVFHNENKSGDLNQALDILTSMKVLSRIEGDETKVKQILEDLLDFFEKKDFKMSLSKVQEMLNSLEYGYTSFWS